jgi:hypothetical protein
VARLWERAQTAGGVAKQGEQHEMVSEGGKPGELIVADEGRER